MPCWRVVVSVILVLFSTSCLQWKVYGQTKCELVELSKCSRRPCADPAKECPGGRCVPCGCKAMCVASAATEQYPLVLCPDGSAALQCKVPQSRVGCSNVFCAGATCKEYLCNGRCTAMCVGADSGRTSISSSSGNAGRGILGDNLAATARPLLPGNNTKPQQPSKTTPAAATGAIGSGTTMQPTVKCDDGSAAVKCKIPPGNIGCSNVRCAGVPCQEYMCGGKCQAVCLAGDTTIRSSSSSGGGGSSNGLNLVATAVPLFPPASINNPNPIPAGGSNPPKPAAVTCPDGSAATQCSVARDQIGCSNIKCAGVACKEYMCGGKCMPMCLPGVTLRAKPQPAALQPAVKAAAGSSSTRSRALLSSPEELGQNTTSGAFTCVGGEAVNCVRNPCDGKNCPPGFSCKSEYCGGCNAACLPNKPPCKSGKDRRPCMGTASRCLLAKFCCGITCVPDPCNDCAATAVGPCPPGQFVSRQRLRCMNCPLGFSCAGGDNRTATAGPEPCNGGFYADTSGLAACKKCDAGLTTPALPKQKGYAECLPQN